MELIRFDPHQTVGEFKPMNAVNNGPAYKRHANDQWRTNMNEYKAANIPFARNHDAAFCAAYGGEFSVDISAIFPNFDADPEDPEAYDFACTDEYIAVTFLAGTETFYRLGQKIEHQIKKHHTLPPKDFEKWTTVCEHIIRHYTEGWNDGFTYRITYWEIWNEPDLDPDDSTHKRTWGGTEKQFYELFKVAVTRLKKRFPHLKIGGPAVSGSEAWSERFLTFCEENRLPLDFFSWHIYCSTPEEMTAKAKRFREMLDRHGYEKTESILNEWNYVRNWTDQFVYTLEAIAGIKGAAFSSACIAEAQKSPIDLLMYYDARVGTGFNGMFNVLTYRPNKGYYPFYWFGKMYECKEIRAEKEPEGVYTLAGITPKGRIRAIVTSYHEDDEAGDTTVKLDFGRGEFFRISLIDETHDGQVWKTTGDLTLTLPGNAVLLIEEV